jgi:hypothetical protein
MTAEVVNLSARRALLNEEYDALVIQLRELEEERGITMADSFLHVVDQLGGAVSGLAPVVPILSP